MEFAPDTLVRDRYRIIRLLGKGGMGAVYLAYDTSLENQVAVKLNHNTSPHAAQQFLREAQLLAMLRHPNLPRVSDYFVEQDTQCLVMDYIAGQDLSQVLEKQGRLPLEQVLRWAEQLSSALEYMHRQNPPVIHRDIKPGNIKLTAEGEAVLVDFGIAKASDASQATATGAVGYTPGYAPPEQYGSGHTGPFSDQYAFAATLYTLLTGQKPVDAVQRVLGQAVLTPPGAINPALPGGVCLALERALSLRPNERFVNVSDFFVALTDVAIGPLASATQVHPTVQQPISAATVVAGQTAPWSAAAPPTQIPAAPRKRRGWLLPVILVCGVAAVVLAAVFLVPAATPTPTPTPTLTLALVNTFTPSSTPSLTLTYTPSQTSPPTQTSTPQNTPTASLTATPQATPTTPAQPIGGGQELAFVSQRGDGATYQIWSMPIYLDPTNGHPLAGEPVQLTTGEGDKFYPAWSPDGRYLIYSMNAGIDEKGDDLGLDLWVMDLTQPDLPPVDITRQRGDDTYADWAADGSLIAYTNDGRSDKVPQVYVIQPDGQNRKRMSFDLREFQPTWSPDMTRLVFMTFINNNNIIFWRRDYENFATPGPFDVARLSERTGQAAEPAFSPDGFYIAYVQMKGRKNNICTVQTASRGADVACLTTTNQETQPNWSPDSQWIVFTSKRDGNSEIYIMSAAGLLQTRLTTDSAEDFQPAWRP